MNQYARKCVQLGYVYLAKLAILAAILPVGFVHARFLASSGLECGDCGWVDHAGLAAK